MTPSVNRGLRWAVWLMLGVALFWIAYRFGHTYMACRADGDEKISCVPTAFYVTFIQVLEHVIATIIKLVAMVLP